ncbi:MAG: hypothetical protein ACE5I5_08760 [Candidatus Heimdallarchaeota archaeon]
MNRFSEGKYQDFESDDKFDINVMDEGARRAVQGYSGGDRTRIAVSFRFAIGRCIADLADIIWVRS